MPITLKVNEERVKELPYGVYRKSNADPEAQAKMIAHFAIDEATGEYLTIDVALELLDEMTLQEVIDTVATIQGTAEEVAVPKV